MELFLRLGYELDARLFVGVCALLAEAVAQERVDAEIMVKYAGKDHLCIKDVAAWNERASAIQRIRSRSQPQTKEDERG
jgi:hypothetical protein